MSDAPELKPCPFCGNDGSGPIEDALHIIHSEHDSREDSWTVQCDRCTATMGYSDSEDDAITAWNRRADLPAPGWQSIETAPRDQTVLLAWLYRGEWQYEAGLAGSTRGGWWHGRATHWMPLPAPPSEGVEP